MAAKNHKNQSCFQTVRAPMGARKSNLRRTESLRLFAAKIPTV